jgi:hypothetical protein
MDGHPAIKPQARSGLREIIAEATASGICRRHTEFVKRAVPLERLFFFEGESSG